MRAVTTAITVGAGEGVARTATQRLSALNAQLAQTEQSVRTLFQLSPVAMVLSRLSDQRLLDGNQHAAHLFDISLETARGQLRTSDVVGRIGGEEFAVLLPETSLEDATKLIERVRVAIERRGFFAEGKDHAVTVSAGVCASQPEETIEQGLRRADEAMYEAKRAGRNRVAASAV